MVQTMRQGFNKQGAGYAQVFDAGSYSIARAKRTNVLGHGIIASGDGFKFSGFTTDAAQAAIAKHATSNAFKLVGEKGSVLVVWKVKA